MTRRGWYDPRIYGPLAMTLRKVNKVSLPMSMALVAAAAYSAARANYLMLVVMVSLAAVSAFLPRLVKGAVMRSVGAGINDEVPALLAMLIPFVASAKDLASILISASDSLKLKFIGFEARRLRYLLSTGYDERRALRILADTTPSSQLREVIRELLNAEEMGLSRSRVASMLYSRALDSVKRSWSNFVKLGESMSEVMTTLTISAAILMPLAMFGSTAIAIPLASLAIVLSPAMAILLVLSRPKLGEPDGGWHVMAVTLLSVLTSSALLFLGKPMLALALLAAASIYGEVRWIEASRSLRSSLRALREASERARLGLPFVDVLRSASSLGRSLVNSIIKAESVAGKIGIGAAIQNLSDLIYDSLRSRESIQVETYIMLALAIASPVIAAASIAILVNYIASSAISGLFNLAASSYALRAVTIMAPVSPLPSSALYRGKYMSSTPSLLALAALIMAMHAVVRIP